MGASSMRIPFHWGASLAVAAVNAAALACLAAVHESFALLSLPPSPFVLALAAFPISFTVTMIVVRALFYLRHRSILGDWVYITRPSDKVAFKDGNYARMAFFVDVWGNLNYRVTLFHSREAARANKRTGIKGSAWSKALRHDPRTGKISILFSVKFDQDVTGNRDRQGLLELTERGDRLEGVWTSVLDRRDVSDGVMTAAREPFFWQLVPSERQ
jgi:hypothetical protein